jgi:hypothetical protein
MTLHPYLGSGGTGPVFGPAVAVRGFVDRGNRLVKRADGSEITVTATVILPIETIDGLRVASKVTFSDGSTGTVQTVLRRDTGGLADGLDHWEIGCT